MTSTITVNSSNQIVLDRKGKKNVWEKYNKELFDDNRPPAGINTSLTIHRPLRTSLKMPYVIQKNNKATGPNEIPSKILKLLDKRGITSLHNVFNTIYEIGHHPRQWLCSTFIPLPKKINGRKCEDHRLLSLMSHTLKIFLKIIHPRIYKKCKRGISDSQFRIS